MTLNTVDMIAAAIAPRSLSRFKNTDSLGKSPSMEPSLTPTPMKRKREDEPLTKKLDRIESDLKKLSDHILETVSRANLPYIEGKTDVRSMLIALRTRFKPTVKASKARQKKPALMRTESSVSQVTLYIFN